MQNEAPGSETELELQGSHCADPLFAAKSPPAQGRHGALPGEKKPGRHLMQESENGSVPKPGWQPEHLVEPEALVWPEVHAWHEVDPELLAKVLAGHRVHELALAPEKEPAAHGEQLVALPSEEKVPAAQSAQADPLMYWPGEQIKMFVQVEAPAGLVLPAPQGEHDDAPDAEKVLAEQGVHEADLPSTE